MSDGETESIRVARVSGGSSETGDSGTAVELPVVEVLTGRGLITGKSGSGKSNTASVVAEKLLDSGFGLLIVDVDGEYYGLKEEYEILHAGADEECDIQVTVEHAEKLASLALEGNVPIILDVSSFLDESEASELLTAVSKHLFAKAKKRKQPFLVLVEEVHEYIPENGSVDECGKMLIKIGKRGRKHGLGVVGISQRPADVKKDFITQCDWLVWHRLTWKNDTEVVRRIIDKEHSEAVEDLDDGEAFLMTDWAETVQRVQFQRKRTFDAGATPGLEDFERPELKSVSDDLVAELREISEDQRTRDDRIAQLREELDRKNSRIAELEAELSDARDMRRMARQFTDALVEHVDRANPGLTERERMRRRGADDATVASGDGSTAGSENENATAGRDGEGPERREDEQYDTAAMSWAGEPDEGSGDGATLPELDELPDVGAGSGGIDRDRDSDVTSDRDGESGYGDVPPDGAEENGAETDEHTGRREREADPVTRGFTGVEENPLGDRATDAFERGETAGVVGDVDGAGEFSRRLREEIATLEGRTRGMLDYYRDRGPGTPMEALLDAGGPEERTEAYARNRRLRIRGLIEHVGRGRYDYRVPDLVREHTGHRQIGPYVERIETAFVPASERAAGTSADERNQVDDDPPGDETRGSRESAHPRSGDGPGSDRPAGDERGEGGVDAQSGAD